MKKFLTLVEVEFRHLIGVLIGFFLSLTAISAFLFFVSATDANRDANRIMNQGGMSAAEFTATNGYFTLSTISNNMLHYVIFILFFFVLIAVVSLGIWQREWAGKSKGIYFLLSLRAPRIRILATKLLATVITSWLFFGMILINLALGSLIMRIILGNALVGNALVAGYLQNAHWMLSFALPASLTHFIYQTFFTIAIFSTMTAWVLLTKSFKWVGGIVGFAFSVATLVVFIYTQTMWLFYDERIIVEWAFVLVSCVVSLLLNWWLISKRVSV